MKLVENIYEANCITHSGTMHADEIFSTAFLDLYLEDIRVFRTTDIPPDISKDVLIYDIGRGKFDHHQIDAKRRENSIPYCSFGLLWQEFGHQFLEKLSIGNIGYAFTLFDKGLVEGIDANDNGLFPKIDAPYKVKTLSDIFAMFNPGYKSNQSESEQFIKAVELAKVIINETLINIRGKVTAKEIVTSKILEHKNHTLHLDEYMPYEQLLLLEEKANDIYFVVYPSNRGGYCIRTVPISLENDNKRLDLPLEWAGLENDDLEKASGIKGMTFCHSKRFIASCGSLETATLAINKILKIAATEETDSPKN